MIFGLKLFINKTQYMKKLTFILLFLTIMFSCDKKKDEGYGSNNSVPSRIYKIKDTSYFNYVPVITKSNGTKITSVPDRSTQDIWIGLPIELDSSYYYEPSFRKIGTERYFAYGGESTAILDIKIADYTVCNSDTMQNHILSRDLFSEYYIQIEPFYNTVSTFAQDTAIINSWINKGELGKHFKRLK